MVGFLTNPIRRVPPRGPRSLHTKGFAERCLRRGPELQTSASSSVHCRGLDPLFKSGQARDTGRGRVPYEYGLDDPARVGPNMAAASHAFFGTVKDDTPPRANRTACSRRIPVALQIPGTTVRLQCRAHVRADGSAARSRAARVGMHRARLVDGHCRPYAVLRSVDGSRSNRNTQSPGPDRHV
jgi:hypothetical protein